MSFSFEDFLLYTKAPESDIKVLSAIIPGVLTYVEDAYGIILENSTKTIKHFLRVSGSTFELPIAPVVSIDSIVYDGLTQEFTYYGNDVVLATSISDIRKPLVITLNVGYISVPNDLKLAVYQHIESLYFRMKNSSDNIDKVINTTGNTTYFNESAIPVLSRLTYDKYSNRTIVMY